MHIKLTDETIKRVAHRLRDECEKIFHSSWSNVVAERFARVAIQEASAQQAAANAQVQPSVRRFADTVAARLETDPLFAASLNEMMADETKAERDAWRDRALAAERHDDVVTCDFKIRAERAEAAIERVVEGVRYMLGSDRETEIGNGKYYAALHIAQVSGLTITPARELTVVWEGGK